MDAFRGLFSAAYLPPRTVNPPNFASMHGKNAFTLFDNVRTVIIQTRQTIVRNVNQAMVIAYFRIGKMIVEDEQKGKGRADYAKETLARLSKALSHEFGKGFSMTNWSTSEAFTHCTGNEFLNR
ncbi:MAG: hypothetical protein JWR12_2994 [Mucilaginibacter sp.]|nr:hypothetical protein [Mucilaginibacter sp.]